MHCGHLRLCFQAATRSTMSATPASAILGGILRGIKVSYRSAGMTNPPRRRPGGPQRGGSVYFVYIRRSVLHPEDLLPRPRPEHAHDECDKDERDPEDEGDPHVAHGPSSPASGCTQSCAGFRLNMAATVATAVSMALYSQSPA